MVLRSSQNTHSTAWLGFLFALLGLLWCGYVAFPSAHVGPCVTSGCEITRNLNIGGISLWWIGGAYFFVQAILSLRGARYLAWRLAQLALFLDALLLMLMFVTGPCFDCLVVAFLIAATTYFLRPTPHGWFIGEQPKQLILLPLWTGLFLGNLVVATDEISPRWVIGPNPTSHVRIFFSPSCPSCREALVAFGNAALFPVFEKEGDLEAIVRLERLLAEKTPMPVALQKATAPDAPLPDISPLTRVIRTAALLRNRATVFKQGFTTLPLIEINGMPKAWLKGRPADPVGQARTDRASHSATPTDAAHSTPSGTDANGTTPTERPPLPETHKPGATVPVPEGDVPWESGEVGQCGGRNTAPCP